MKALKCPHCGSTDLRDLDCYDMEVTFDYNIDNEVVLRKINGYCFDCGAKDLVWTEVYEFTECKDIRIIN